MINRHEIGASARSPAAHQCRLTAKVERETYTIGDWRRRLE